jgi:hypothetical protein
VNFGVNARCEKPNPCGGMRGVSQHGLAQRLAQADHPAQATGLGMVAAGRRPRVGNYLGGVTKPRIIAAVREGAGDRAAELIGHLKKGEMAREAGRLLADTGWLPSWPIGPRGRYRPMRSRSEIRARGSVPQPAACPCPNPLILCHAKEICAVPQE